MSITLFFSPFPLVSLLSDIHQGQQRESTQSVMCREEPQRYIVYVIVLSSFFNIEVRIAESRIIHGSMYLFGSKEGKVGRWDREVFFVTFLTL